MTIDEELSLLEESVRRLKLDYDIFFGGGSKRPPADAEWRVQSLIKKFSDNPRLSFAQRFRFNTISQKYALYNGLWQQKLKIKEEGYRRPQDARLGIQGLRPNEQNDGEASGSAAFRARVTDVDADQESVQQLYQAMMSARLQAGEKSNASLDSFRQFLRKKTDQLRQEHGCRSVEYSVEIEDGQVRLKAKAQG